MKTAVHFGAGNIGRGFIGLLLAQAGYEVVFVDVNETILDGINREGRYPVHIAGEDHQVIWVEKVRAIHSGNFEGLKEAVAQADLITTAVGVNVLPIIGRSLARVFNELAEEMPSKSVNVLACENAVGNGDLLKQATYEHLNQQGRFFCDSRVGFPNTTVDRIVPENTDTTNPLSVLVEPFSEWNVEKGKLVGQLEPIPGMTLVDNLEAYIERKLFTLNTGHAITAYLGYEKGCATIVEAIGQKEIQDLVLGAMREAGKALVQKHGFDPEQHEAYIQKILSRFQNVALADPVERVGRDPLRKLSPRDRLIAPSRTALTYGVEPECLVRGIVAALHFDYPEDSSAQRLQTLLNGQGLEGVLQEVCGLSPEEALFGRIQRAYE